MSQVDRRGFLKGAAAVAAAAAMPPALRAAEPAPYAGARSEPEWKKVPCRLCGVGCGLLVAIQDGRAMAVKGDPDSPVSRGLACARGYYAIQALYGRDRLTRALVRREGRQVPVPLADALDLVAQRLRDTYAAHGKDSVALYGSGQWTVADAYVAAKLFKGALGTSNVETSARLHGGSATAGLRSTFGLDGPVGCYEDLDHADVFVLWSHNMAETDPVLFSRILQRRRTNPAVRIVDLAPRTTRTSYAADRSLLYAPETEVAIANAICQEIVARKWADRDFVDRHVAFARGRTGIGYAIGDADLVEDLPTDATWSDWVRFLADYAPERAAEVTGVAADDLRWLASLYADRSRKVLSIWGPSLNQHARGTWANNALYNIHLLVAKVASPGNGALCLAGQPGSAAGALDAGAPSGSLPRGSIRSANDRRTAARLWGVPLERIDARPGPGPVAMFRALERGDVRFLWIQATNPMVSLPDLTRYQRATGRQDTFIVVSEAYPTATTDIADVVLPAAMWFER